MRKVTRCRGRMAVHGTSRSGVDRPPVPQEAQKSKERELSHTRAHTHIFFSSLSGENENHRPVLSAAGEKRHKKRCAPPGLGNRIKEDFLRRDARRKRAAAGSERGRVKGEAAVLGPHCGVRKRGTGDTSIFSLCGIEMIVRRCLGGGRRPPALRPTPAQDNAGRRIGKQKHRKKK